MDQKNKLALLIFTVIFSASWPSSDACHPTDKAALLDFKSRIISDPEGLLKTWTPATDCCRSWAGVTCNPAGRVVNVSRGQVGDEYSDTHITFSGKHVISGSSRPERLGELQGHIPASSILILS